MLSLFISLITFLGKIFIKQLGSSDALRLSSCRYDNYCANHQHLADWWRLMVGWRNEEAGWLKGCIYRAPRGLLHAGWWRRNKTIFWWVAQEGFGEPCLLGVSFWRGDRPKPQSCGGQGGTQQCKLATHFTQKREIKWERRFQLQIGLGFPGISKMIVVLLPQDSSEPSTACQRESRVFNFKCRNLLVPRHFWSQNSCHLPYPSPINHHFTGWVFFFRVRWKILT